MEQVNPRVRMRLTHPEELSWHLLNRMLFQVGQNEEQFVCERGQWTGVIRTIAATGAGVSIDRAVLQLGDQSPLESGE
jgi:hypothetical protein